MPDREKVIGGLESHANPKSCETCAGEVCPYCNMGGSYYTGVTCSSFLAADALALLKEQEARVLTPREFDEVRLSKPIWLEVRNMGLLGPALSRYLRHEYGKVAFSLIENRAIERDVTEYNWDWRCWSARPTEEQMRDTPWEAFNEITPEMIEAVGRNEKRIKERADRIYIEQIAEKRAEIERLKAEIAKMPPLDYGKLAANPPEPPKEEDDGDEL